MAKTNHQLYQERQNRIIKAINLEPLDRVPVVFEGMAFAPRYLGISIADFITDPEAPVFTALDTMDKIGNKFGGFDGINHAVSGRTTVLLAAGWLSKINVPGRELPPDTVWQVHEGEVMTVNDYDTIINNGWETFVKSYLPRVVDEADFAEASGWVKNNAARCIKKIQDRGYYALNASSTAPPYEAFCGGRSMNKFLLDLYRIPDKVQAAMDVALPEIIQGAIQSARTAGVPAIWVGGWRTASSMVSPKIMDRFVWPYVLQIVDALLAADIIPVFHWDQDWTRDIFRLQALPQKKCILNPDGMTDMRQFKKLVGDRMAMMGDVPSSMFSIGSPEDIDKYVHDLVNLFEGRGLILCPGCDAPINTKPENMEAFIAAAYKYGTQQ
jgi:uroporphyrinogen-III decarboxylase